MLRREFLVGCGLALTGCAVGKRPKGERILNWQVPEETAPHTRTWMAFGAQDSIWGRRLLPAVRQELALIANTLVAFEPVTVLVRPSEMKQARNLFDREVELVACALDDLWIRDTGPVFVSGPEGRPACFDLHFNGWGDKQVHQNDAKVAQFIAENTGFPLVSAGFVAEGGGLEFDGSGTVLATESCTLNPNRNPGLSRTGFERRLKEMGAQKVIWLPGLRDQDITDGHIDFYARFIEPGVVVAAMDPDPESPDYRVTQQHLKILGEAKDAQGKVLQLHLLQAPVLSDPPPDFAAGYVGYYPCKGAVLLQKFGDETADEKARETLGQLFPNRELVSLRLDALAEGGGTIHCATLHEPAL